MRASILLAAGTLATFSGVASAQVTLNAFMTADNAFAASLSTDPTAAGDSNFLTGNNWGSTFNASVQITAPGTYYLQILAQDFGDPASFIAELGLMNFQPGWSATFSNNFTTLLTNTTDWTVSNQGFGINPIAPVVINGADGVGPWGDRPLISNNALNIWHPSNPDNAYFTTVITVVPTPTAIALLGMGGLVATRRRR